MLVMFVMVMLAVLLQVGTTPQVGEATYSQSPDIAASFLYPNNWRLALAGLRPRDGGPYLCQVGPPTTREVNGYSQRKEKNGQTITDKPSERDPDQLLNFSLMILVNRK